MFNHRSTKKDRVCTEQEEAVRFELGFEACIGVRGKAPPTRDKDVPGKEANGQKNRKKWRVWGMI